MPIVRGVSDFEWMLGHELCLAERHRRFVSLAMIKTSSETTPGKLLGDTMRNSDVYFDVDDSLGAVLMSETDTSGNQVAVKRFKKACDDAVDVHFATVCYPDDQMSAACMISAAREQLSQSEQASRSQVTEE